MGINFRKHLTTEEVIQNATDKLAGDISVLVEERESALNVFNSTAMKLGSVNARLQESVERLDNLAGVIAMMKGNARSTISSNEQVINKINELMGVKIPA